MDQESGKRMKLPSLRRLLKLTAEVGVAGAKTIVTVLLSFLVVNVGLVIYGMVRLFTSDFSWGNLSVMVVVFLLSVGFTLLAVYLTYRYMLSLVVRKVYELTLAQRKSISESMIRFAVGKFGQAQAEGEDRNRIDIPSTWSRVVYKIYQSVPLFFQSGITNLLNRIPVTGFIIGLKDDIIAGNEVLAAEKLRLQVDDFFEDRILGPAHNRPVWILLLVNAVALFSLIYWGMTIYSVGI